jgi:hypothetical protein
MTELDRSIQRSAPDKLQVAEEYRQAWSELQSARSAAEREAAILHAMSRGVALSDIETLFDWLDAVARQQLSGAKKPIAIPAPWSSCAAGPTSAPHFRT